MANGSIPQRVGARKQYLNKLRAKLREANGNQGSSLSSLFTDPVVVAAFRRAERDSGSAFAVPAPKSPVLPGGEALTLETETMGNA